MTDKPQTALLISVYKPPQKLEVCLEHLAELEFLVETYGLVVLDRLPCQIRRYEAATFITEGKLQELIDRADELKVDVIVLDDEIAPAQQRNLEKAFGRRVMDRTEVILEIFAQRAQTKEARLQIDLAKQRYLSPRLKKMWSHLSRQQGTGGAGGTGAYTKGEGEKQIEIDKRIVKRKIDQLQKEISEVRSIRETQRSKRHRNEIPTFAIVGYTNAGKSTLLNALTDAEVFVEDKLFATLDTTTRKFALPNHQDILLIDTVGFIRKLPHLLVAAFKSTLEEVMYADILLHLIDASHPMAEEQAEATYEVLKELSADKKPILTVFNKLDKVENPSKLMLLKMKFPRSCAISALQQEGFDDLLDLMCDELSKQRKAVRLRIPQSAYAAASEVIRFGHVLSQEYEENDILFFVELPSALLGKYEQFIVADS